MSKEERLNQIAEEISDLETKIRKLRMERFELVNPFKPGDRIAVTDKYSKHTIYGYINRIRVSNDYPYYSIMYNIENKDGKPGRRKRRVYGFEEVVLAPKDND